MTLRSFRRLHRRGLSRQRLRDPWLHRLVGDRLFRKDLWTFPRDAVARGWLIGSLVAARPLLGLQLLVGVLLADDVEPRQHARCHRLALYGRLDAFAHNGRFFMD